MSKKIKNNGLLPFLLSTALVITGVAGCKQENSEQKNTSDTKTAEVKTDIQQNSGFPQFRGYYTGNNNCYIKLPQKLIYGEQAFDNSELDITILSFFTMLTSKATLQDEKNRMFNEMKIIVKGCDVNESYNGSRALETALLYANTEAITFLLDNGADPSKVLESNEPKVTGLTLFEVAAKIEKQNEVTGSLKQAAKLILNHQQDSEKLPKAESTEKTEDK